jgi:SAM-dependent methyltransferase
MPEAIFAHPRLARIYDPLDPDRGDLDAYAAMAAEFGARSVLDVGCGTGTLACLLARRGLAVTGVDPALASLEVARAKPGADAVRWLHGDATSLPPMQADLATMTGNVAQVFVSDEDWAATLRGAHAALRPGGRLVFETRDPARQAWRGWTREQTRTRTEVPRVGVVEKWQELTMVSGELVSFRSVFVFEADGAVLTSESTLRFREPVDVERSLSAAGYRLDEVRDAPDRPGLEFVFIAIRLPTAGTSAAGLA